MPGTLQAVSQRLRKGWLLASIIVVAATGTGLVTERLGWLEPIELLAYDQALRAFSPPPQRSPQVVIVAIDDRSIQAINQDERWRREFGTWPYVRTIWARVFEHLANQGARAIVFDAVMDEAQSTGDDAPAEIIQARRIPYYLGFSTNPKVPPLPKVSPTNRLPEHIPPRPPVPTSAPAPASVFEEFEEFQEALDRPRDLEATARALAFPVQTTGLLLPELRTRLADGTTVGQNPVPPIEPLIAVTAGFGLVDPEEDPDGKLRRTRFAYSDGANSYVMLPIAVAADLLRAERLELSPGKLRLGDRELAINPDGSAGIDYGGRLDERFPTASLIDVLEDWARTGGMERALPADLFRDKVVVLGGFALATWDQKPTPFESRSPAVVKQAAEIDTLLAGEYIVDAPRPVAVAVALFAALLSAFLILALRSTLFEIGWMGVLFAGLLVGTGTLLARGKVHLPLALVAVSGELACIAAIAVNHLYANRERDRMRQMFSRYVSRDVAKQLVDQAELPQLSGEDLMVTAFFSDIRGFSTFSERYKDDPRALVNLLNTYLTRVTARLQDHGACIDKYIGDAVVCLFGAPVRHADHAVRACRAALAAQAEVARLREEFRAKGLPDVYTRIGLNSAVMFVGNMGSEQLINYTAIGDGMNLASRLEGANKSYGTLIMIGPMTYQLARDAIEARELDWVRVAGKTEPVAVYELLGLKGELPEARRRAITQYEAALALYRQARFTEAAAAMQAVLELEPEDGPAHALLERCQKYAVHPPPMPFDGVASLEK
jgi:adenylate cyclase